MGQWDKLLKQIQENPQSVRFEDLDKVLRRMGLEHKQSRHGTSHHRYVSGEDQLVIPKHGNPVKEVYVRQVIQILTEKGLI